MTTYSSNPYCVEKLLHLSQRHAVVATDDIFDEQGIKLLAKGAEISSDMQDRLLLRKLKAPLEASLSVAEGVTLNDYFQQTLDLIDQLPALQCIAGSRAAREILRDGKRLHLPPPLCMLLTCMRESDPKTFRVNQIVTAVCAGISAMLGANANEAQGLQVIAALHDIGEMYINPEYLRPERQLTPKEWKHVATHPQVGQLLIRDLTSLPALVGTCVGHHHERQDGSGYPGQIASPDLHRLAGWLAVADAVGALVEYGPGVGERIAMALRIVPEEFERGAADAIIRAMQPLRAEKVEVNRQDCFSQATALLQRMAAGSHALREVLEQSTHSNLRQVCLRALGLLDGFAKSMRATGILYAYDLAPEDSEDGRLMAEMSQIVSEVAWRIRNLARNLFLRVDAWNDTAMLASIQPVIDLLDGEVRPQAA